MGIHQFYHDREATERNCHSQKVLCRVSDCRLGGYGLGQDPASGLRIAATRGGLTAASQVAGFDRGVFERSQQVGVGGWGEGVGERCYRRHRLRGMRVRGMTVGPC